MKNSHKKMAALISSSIFIISIAFLLSVFITPTITGFVAYDVDSLITISNKTVTIEENIEDITREQAIEAITQAEEDIEEINISGFSINYIGISLFYFLIIQSCFTLFAYGNHHP